MNGCIIANTPIAVDYWRITPQDPYLIHFLSHMHSDHTSGLSSSWRRPIYCSEVTSKILRSKLQVCRSFIHVLPIGQPTIIPLGREGRETLSVTPIDANHCPGAVMFLFEGYFGKILYTADFKYTPSMFSEPGLDDSPSIDTLYLDNTFNDPQCDWPSNDVSAGLIENIISTAIGHSDIVIALHSLGKEELLVRIAKKFKRWIAVTPRRFKMLQLLELPNVFTTDRDASNIKVVCQAEITWKNLIQWNSNGRKTVVIVPSALFKLGKTKRAFDHPNVYLVPYTSHSSYSELKEFVGRLRPREVVPIVNDKRNSSSNVSHFQSLLRRDKPAAPPKMSAFLRDEPTTADRIRVSTKSAPGSEKPTRSREKPVKCKIAQGVVFADVSEEQEASHGPSCQRIRSTCNGEVSSESGDCAGAIKMDQESDSSSGMAEPANKKQRQESGVYHLKKDHREGRNLENGRLKNADIRDLMPPKGPARSSTIDHCTDVELPKDRVTETRTHRKRNISRQFRDKAAVRDTIGNYCTNVDMPELPKDRVTETRTHPERNISRPPRDKAAVLDIAEGGSLDAEARVTGSRPTSREGGVTDSRSGPVSEDNKPNNLKLAVIHAKHRLSFYKAYERMQLMLKREKVTSSCWQ